MPYAKTPTPTAAQVSYFHSPTVYPTSAPSLTDAEYAVELKAARKRIRARRLVQRQAAAQRRVEVDAALMREYVGSVQTAQAWRDNVEAHA